MSTSTKHFQRCRHCTTPWAEDLGRQRRSQNDVILISLPHPRALLVAGATDISYIFLTYYVIYVIYISHNHKDGDGGNSESSGRLRDMCQPQRSLHPQLHWYASPITFVCIPYYIGIRPKLHWYAEKLQYVEHPQ